MYDISTRDSAKMTLEKILQVNDIEQEWVSSGFEPDNIIQKHKKQIQQWNLGEEVFLVKHITSSVNRLEDVNKYGLINLSEVLTRDTTINELLNKNEIFFDIQNKMLIVSGKCYDLDELRRGYRDEVLNSIHRAIYNDYLSTFLYNYKPWSYGSNIVKHPEFMIDLSSINEKCKEFVEWWKNNSIGYMITAKVPFRDVYHGTFGIEDNDIFVNDSKNDYWRSKKCLIKNALYVSFDITNSVYLFINSQKYIRPEQFIFVEEKI